MKNEDTILSLYYKFLKSFYGKNDTSSSGKTIEKIEGLFDKNPEWHDSVKGSEIKSLIAEYKKDLTKAIYYREQEIERMKKVRKVTGVDYFTNECLSETLDLLAILYDQNGESEKAIKILKKSKNFCKRNKIPFDGQDILKEYLSGIEKNN